MWQTFSKKTLFTIAVVFCWFVLIENGHADISSNDEPISADAFMRLSELRCSNCTLIVRDLLDMGAIANSTEVLTQTFNGDPVYLFRLNLLTNCDDCYRAAHFWEVNMLNRRASNDDISRWLASAAAKPVLDMFKKPEIK